MNPIDPAPETNEVPSNCLVLPQRDGYRVEFEVEASKIESGYEVWLSLFNGDELCSSASVMVSSLDQFTIKGLAIGYAEGWDRG